MDEVRVIPSSPADQIRRRPNLTGSDIPVLILNYGGWDDTLAVVSRLYPEGLDIWVIDNGSPRDRSPELLTRFPGIGYLPLGRNWGWAGGYNRAIAYVRRIRTVEQVYILNNDAKPEEDAIVNAVRHLRDHPEAAGVGSMMLSGDGRDVLFDGAFRDPPLDVANVGTGLVEAPRVHGGGFALSLAAFDDVGPFHEPYFLYHEESEWCLRARASGWLFFADGTSRIRHDGGGSDVNENREYYLARNRYLAFRRGFPLEPYETSIGALVNWDFADQEWRPHLQDVILEAMVDGVAGRFGPRPAAESLRLRRWLAMPRLRAYQYLFRLERKIRTFLGRPHVG